MKKFILPILLLHFAIAVNAANYYLSSSTGNDSRTYLQAQNSSTPWQTIAALNANMSHLQPGDSVLFKSGESFFGVYDAAMSTYDGINITVSGTSGHPITFSSYGTGAKPVINGFSFATGWTQVRTNVWEAPFWQPHGKERMVIRNNQQQGIGRYPNLNAGNGGYLNIDANNGTSQITCNSLPSSPSWTGADIVVRKDRWTLDRSPITSQSGTTLNFTPGSGDDHILGNNFGFFIVNSTNTLDQDGEWFYDNSRSKLQMYFSNNNPSAYTVQASTVETLVNIPFQNYLTFNNLSFIGADSFAIRLTNSNNVTVNNCTINFTGIDAVNALSSWYFRMQYCNISNSDNCVTNLYWYCNYATIQYDTLKNTGLIAAMGQNSGTGSTRSGINIKGTGNLIQYCEVDSTGYDGIHFEGDSTVVQKCYVNTFSLVVDDCGGIYTGQGTTDYTVYNNKSVLDNIVVNGVGARFGTNDTTIVAAHGFYFDDNTNHTVALRNTAANCGSSGFFAHNDNNVGIQNNTFYNNGSQQFLGDRTFRTDVASNVTFQNNICFSKTASQLASRLESYDSTNDLPSIGTFDSNYYCRPLDSNYMFYTMYEVGAHSGQYSTAYQNLSSWRSFLGLDLHSHNAPATISPFAATNLSGVDMFFNGSFTSNINGVGTWSPTGDINPSWLSSKLDGGTLQISATNYSGNSFYLTIPTDSTITAGQGYQLSLTLQGATSGGYMTVFLEEQDSPNSTITEQAPLVTQVNIPIPTTRQDFKFGFIPTTIFAGKRVAIKLVVPYTTGQIWIDNVMLQRATITPTNPDDYIVFQYNPGNTTKTFSVSGTYYDAKGATYSGTITLQPYTSLVLFKQYTAPGSMMAQQSILLAGGLVDASSNNITVNNTAAKLRWQVDNQSSTASYYEVQRSTDAQNFTTIGRATAKTEGSSIIYEYSDASPLPGKNYYRITQHDEKNALAVSKIIMVNNISFRVNPNPAKNVIHVSFGNAIKASDNLDKEVQIHNAAGVLVQTVRLPSTDNVSRVDINVASLPKGVYVLSASSEGQTFSKTFLKQ